MLELILPFFAILPILISVFLYVFSSGASSRKIAIVFQSFFVAFSGWLLFSSQQETVLINVGAYESFLGITLRADNLAAVFVLLTSVIFLAVALYSLNDNTPTMFWFLLFILEGVLVGLFLTRDLFNVFVLVEVGTVVVAVLLMFEREWRNMYAGLIFIIVNIVVMQFFLFGLGYIYMMTGVLDMEAITPQIAEIDIQELALPYTLIMTSIVAKCSLLPILTFFPKINSLPGARSSIAAIMSALHIKSGLYLFIRVQDIFGWNYNTVTFFLIVGIITAFAGIILALAQKDIRLILAYSTVAQVSLIVIGLNLNDDYSYTGAVFHIVNHAIFKLALFMGAGMIRHRYKTADVTKIRGLYKSSPIIAISTAMAILGIAGMPLFNGFVSKYFLGYGANGAVEWIINFINFGTILICLKYATMFLGTPSNEAIKPMADWYKQITILGLGIICLVLGIVGVPAMQFLFNTIVDVNFMSMFEKVIIFFASLIIGLLFFKFGFTKIQNRLFALLADIDLNVRIICVSIGVFFAIFLIFVGL